MTAIAPPSRDEVLAVLGSVIDPELGADIVSLGMVPDVTVGDDGGLYLQVQRPHDDKAKRGPFDAKMTRHAQTQLEPFLREENGSPVLVTKRGKATFSGHIA